MPAPQQAPNAALLIDFDNVTLGIRSDLTKELRHLLDSDIIKGKVSVQRAYADWRRYPQYIVPLSESSIDLIFAPAFGTNKKNATDIRLAIDATELVFTRPEIGTFILLSGDSDFSSLVIKLKEYGKYVIGVGIRESASDILIQNCDEYYSYSDLAGLTRELDTPSTQRDPWELVVEAVDQMVRNRDVMRADRLKQVMQQLDSNFDESNAGFNRFSKFIQEAGNRGLIRLTRLDNGQFEVSPARGAAPAAAPQRDGARGAAPASEREGQQRPEAAERQPESGEGKGRSRRGRGRRGERQGAAESIAAAPPPVETAVPPVAAPAEAASEEQSADKEKDRRRRRRGGRGRRGGEGAEAPAAPVLAGAAGLTLAEAFHLLSRALGELPTPVAHENLRARMAALHGREDPMLEPERFPRLLRQANDAEVADVRMIDEGNYEVSPHKADLALQFRPAATAAAAGTPVIEVARPAAAVRFRSGSTTVKRSQAVPMVGVISLASPEEMAVGEVAPVAAAAVEVAEGPTAAPSPAEAGRRTRSAPKKVVKKSSKKAAAAKETAAPKGTAAAKKAAAASSRGAATAAGGRSAGSAPAVRGKGTPAAGRKSAAKKSAAKSKKAAPGQ